MLALAVAEGKLQWYSYNRRDLRNTVQGLLLDERERLAGRRVFKTEWSRADQFVLEHVVHARSSRATDLDEFLRHARRGDFVVTAEGVGLRPEIVAVRSIRGHRLCRRAD